MKISKLIIYLLGLFAVICAHAAMPSSAGKAKQVLTLTQSVGLGGDSISNAQVAPLVNSSAGFGTNVLRTQVRAPLAIGLMALPVLDAGMLESEILATASQHFKANGPVLANSMKGWMANNGVSFAWFSYEQRIMVTYPHGDTTHPAAIYAGGPAIGGAGMTSVNPLISSVWGGAGGGGWTGGGSAGPSTEERLLLWTMSTDQSGRLIFGNPKLVPPKPKTLYVVYTPLRVEGQLPTNWKYPNAGTLFIQTRDEDFGIIPNTDQRIDVAGAFDEPDQALNTSVSVDADSAVRCLVDHHNTGCTNTLSVRSLMDDRGASMAVVDYVRMVQPVYDYVDGAMVPRASIALTERKVTYSGCFSATYYNKGSFGFMLTSTVSRYLVAPDSQFMLAGEVHSNVQSPTVVYEGTAAVPVNMIATLSDFVIDPSAPTSGQLVAVASLPIVRQDLPALTVAGSVASTVLYKTTGFIYNPTAVNRLNAHVYVGCDASNSTIQVSAGWQDTAADASVSWKQNVNRYTVGAVFTKGTAQSLPIYTREDPQNSWCVGSAVYDGNKNITVTMDYRTCEYGGQLAWGNVDGARIPIDQDTSPWFYKNDGLQSLLTPMCPGGTAYASVSGWALQSGPLVDIGGGETGNWVSLQSYPFVTRLGCAFPSGSACPAYGVSLSTVATSSGTYSAPICVTPPSVADGVTVQVKGTLSW